MRFLQLSDFAGRIGDAFSVDVEGQATSFILVEAVRLPSRPVPGMVREPFSLVFRHEAAVVFPQRIYAMNGSTLGDFGIFLVPVARDRDGFLYQAVFN